jgi:cytochrome P450
VHFEKKNCRALVVNSSVPHRAMIDTKLGGYDIPKDTAVYASLYALHMSEEVWGDPENFRPERFLDSKGQLCLINDKSLPFGAGKRLCAGETFARNTLFLCVTALLQNFNMKGVGDEIPSLDDTNCGLIRLPNDFLVQFTSR